MVDATRRVAPIDGVVVERVADAAGWTVENRRPPRARLEFAALKAASARAEPDAVALLSDVVHQGLTTPGRLVEVLEGLPRLPGRAGLVEILADVAAGTRSVLERRYLLHVERAHGLPAGDRQLRVVSATGTVHRDVRYREQRTLVELDGAFGHRDAVDRWADLGRDLEAALADEITLRPGWAQVLEPCRLAQIVGLVLRRRGWEGRVCPCGPGCRVDDGGSGPTYGPGAPSSYSRSA